MPFLSLWKLWNHKLTKIERTKKPLNGEAERLEKIYISVLQDESVKFREKLLEMYKKQIEFTEGLPCGDECRKYQESMNENYPTEKPLTADTVVEKIKKDADNVKIQKKNGKRHITVETGDGKKEEISEDEVVFNSTGVSQKFDGLKINYINEKG